MARIAKKRQEADRHKLAVWLLIALGVIASMFLGVEIAVDRWQHPSPQGAGLLPSDIPVEPLESHTLIVRHRSVTDPSDKFLGHYIHVRGHIRRYYPGVVELVSGQCSDLSSPPLMVEANLNVQGWTRLQSAVQEDDSRLFRLGRNELNTAKIGSALIVSGTMVSNTDGKWVMVDCDNCVYQGGHFASINVDSTATSPTAGDPFGIDRMMAEKNLTLNGQPVRSTADFADLIARAREATQEARAIYAQDYDEQSPAGDDEPIVMRIPMAGRTYVVRLSSWRAAQAEAARYWGKTAIDVVCAQVVYECLVDEGLYPSVASAIVIANTGLPIIPSDDELAMEIRAKTNAAIRHSEAMERAYGR